MRLDSVLVAEQLAEVGRRCDAGDGVLGTSGRRIRSLEEIDGEA